QTIGMLTAELVRSIESFVETQPRSIEEVARLIKKNWRTADKYLQEIEREHGTISVKVFRPGTRGALKIAYWSSVEKASSTVFQELLEKDIMQGRKKEDFSEFDIFQLVKDKNKHASVENAAKEDLTDLDQLVEIIRGTRKQLLIFSGNLSFINLKNKQIRIYDEVDCLIKRGVSIKVVCNIDLAGKENVERMLSLNFKNACEQIEIRHREQPLRGMISDNKVIRIKEVKEPTGKIHELNKRTFIFYTIRDSEWALWLSRIFWKMFSASIDANKRIAELKKLR
ncbi:hypothetical protein JW711_04295, partial [Candidatus Woesearchaeota archaeon]|nr:hypothetical protein [Candidatus Woesearchaeota archaeon]